MYARVKEVRVNKRKNCKNNAIKDKDGTLLTEPDEIQFREDGKNTRTYCMIRMGSLSWKTWKWKKRMR